MNFALLAHSAMLIPLRCLVHTLITGPQNTGNQPALAQTYCSKGANKSVDFAIHTSRYANRNTSMVKPLRVVRVLEAGQARSAVGRMLISGRMADVCAELDRLAAGEAAHSVQPFQ
jgi:hypothetical protein